MQTTMKFFIFALFACFSGLKCSEIAVSKGEIDELIVDYINQNIGKDFFVGSMSSMSYNDNNVNLNYNLKNIKQFSPNYSPTIKLTTSVNSNDVSSFIQVFQTFNIDGLILYKGTIEKKTVDDIARFRLSWNEVRQDVSFNGFYDGNSTNLIDLQVNTTFSDPEITFLNGERKEDDTIKKILIKTFDDVTESFDKSNRKMMPSKKEWFNDSIGRGYNIRDVYKTIRNKVPRRLFGSLVLF